MSNLADGQYQQLIHSISDCLANGQQLAVQQANQTLIETYQTIDRYILVVFMRISKKQWSICLGEKILIIETQLKNQYQLLKAWSER